MLDTANCTKLFITETDAGVVDIQWEKVVAGVPTTAVFNLAVTFAAMPTDIAIVKRTNDYYFYMRFGHAWLRLGAFNAGIAPNRVGVHCANNSTLYSLHYIDFIRFFANTGNLP